MSASIEPKPYQILVYGAETKGIGFPTHAITSRKYTLSFAKKNDAARFQDFDVVIVFQGTFESFEWVNDRFRSHLRHTCDHDELDKRTKEGVQFGFMRGSHAAAST